MSKTTNCFIFGVLVAVGLAAMLLQLEEGSSVNGSHAPAPSPSATQDELDAVCQDLCYVQSVIDTRDNNSWMCASAAECRRLCTASNSVCRDFGGGANGVFTGHCCCIGTLHPADDTSSASRTRPGLWK